MQSEQRPGLPTSPEVLVPAPKSSSRRRLLKAGVGLPPVVLSFASQPVRAGSVSCRAASAFASVAALAPNATTSANTAQLCFGKGPDAWKATAPNFWPGGVNTAVLQFTSVFGGAYTVTTIGTIASPSITSATPTLFQVLIGAGVTNRDILARNLVAAYLNLQQTLTPATVLSVAQMQTMWQTAGGAAPSAYVVNGMQSGWTVTQVNQFLLQTFSAV